MGNIFHTLFVGAFAIMALTVVYVKAGQKGGATGGEQTSKIVNSLSGGMANTISSLEGA